MPGTLAKRHILLVEDDHADERAFRRAVTERDPGLRITVARDASEALMILASFEPRMLASTRLLVVLDVDLPGMDGLEWLARLRRNSLFCGLPVLVLTGTASEEVRAKARRLGVHDVFAKADLDSAIERVLARLGTGSRADARTTGTAKRGAENTPGPNVLIVDDDVVDRQELRRQIERMQTTPWSILEAASGEEAFDRVRATRPQLVFVDYSLPDADGVRILRELRVRTAAAPPHFVAVTGAGSEEVARRFFLLGVQDYLVKRALSPGAVHRMLEHAARLGRPAPLDAPGRRVPTVLLSGSSGALPVCHEVLGQLPADVPFAVLVVLHLNRGTGQTRLVDVLARQGDLPVVWSEDGMELRPGRVHVARPGADLGLVGGRLWHAELSNYPEPVPSIDIALSTLSGELRSDLVSVHLSGMGTDGAAGAVHVRQSAGDVWIQDPSEAEFASIPSAVLQTGVVDRTLTRARLAAALLDAFAGR